MPNLGSLNCRDHPWIERFRWHSFFEPTVTLAEFVVIGALYKSHCLTCLVGGAQARTLLGRLNQDADRPKVHQVTIDAKFQRTHELHRCSDECRWALVHKECKDRQCTTSFD